MLSVGGVRAARPGRRARLAGVRPRRGRLPGRGPAPSATRSPAYDVYYAGKAFLCTAVARWVADEGLCLDVCTGGELAVAERAGFPMERVGFHGNNKSPAEIERAVRLGVGRVIADSSAEIERLAEIAPGWAPPSG